MPRTTVESASGSTTVAPPDDDGGPSSVAPNGEEVEVLALDNNFRPEELEVEAGTTVIWENGGRNDHNIVPADDSDRGASTSRTSARATCTRTPSRRPASTPTTARFTAPPTSA